MKLSRFFSFRGEINRAWYLAVGLGLMAVKYTVDALVVKLSGGDWWPWGYFVWPSVPTMSESGSAPLGYQLAAISIPFVWIGTALTMQRLRDAGAPPWLVVLFFLPCANVAFFALFCILPSMPLPGTSPVGKVRLGSGAPPKLTEPESTARIWVSGLYGALPAGLVSFCLIFLISNGFQVYGSSLFLGAPFCSGFIAAIAYSATGRRSLNGCLFSAMASQVICGVMLLVALQEGAICLLMALPLGFMLAIFGGMAGHGLAWSVSEVKDRTTLAISPILILPVLALIEKNVIASPTLYEAATSIEIAAPPEIVWQNVIGFRTLDEPSELIFRAGVAYPMSAKITGKGVGATRQCVFSTGSFEEPITAWNEPELLAFDVTKCPPPLTELNPFGVVRPPHLEGYLVSERGQFKLLRLENGNTRLEGTTWYRHGLAPEPYWRLWSDQIIHAIHNRVLQHIKAESEGTSGAART